MALKYIFGGIDCDKNEFILNEVVKITETADNEKKSIIYIVPEQFSLQSEKNLIEKLKNKATTRAQVLSFNRLAFHVFSETGNVTGAFLDDIGKTMLLRKLLFEIKDQLLFFNRAIDKQGFMEQLSSIISEFYRYRMTPELLDIYAEKVRAKENFYLKMKDLTLIFRTYIDYIQNNYISIDATLDILSQRIEQSLLLNGSEVYISEFRGFTPQEYSIIAKIFKCAANVTIALDQKYSLTHYDSIKETDPYAEIKRTVNKLTKLAIENNVRIDKPYLLDKKEYLRNLSEEIAFLEKNYLSFKPSVYEPDNSHIDIFVADNKYTEIHKIAAEIIELVRIQKYSYTDIAILLGNVSTYERDLRNIFKLYEIPIFIDDKKDILSQPLVELIRSAIDIVAYDFKYDDVFRFLRTRMTKLDDTKIDDLENYVLAYGVRGYKWKEPEWKFGFDKEGLQRFDKEDIHESKAQLLEMLEPIMGNKPNEKICIKEFCERIFKMLEMLKVKQTLENWVLEQEDNDRERSRQISQIWNKVCGVFEVLVEILGTNQVTLREFTKIIESGFKVTDMGIIPPQLSQVIVGDMERTRLSNIKVLFVMGANEGQLPSKKDEKGILSDEERQAIDPTDEILAPSSKRKSFEQQFLMYQGIMTAADKIYFSYTSGQLDGKSHLPSNIIAKIKKIYPRLIEKDIDLKNEISLARPLFEQIPQMLRGQELNVEINDLGKKIMRFYASDDQYRDKMQKMKNIITEKVGKENLSTESSGMLYNDVFSTSVSKLERYVQCPYAYFVRHNLGALERKVYEVQAVEVGNLYHEVLEYFSKSIDAEGLNFRDVDREKIGTIVDTAINEIAPRLSSEVMLSTARYKYALKSSSRILKKSIWALAEHFRAGKFEVYGTELAFDINGPITSIIVELKNGKKLILRGRIDRIDILDTDGKQYVKIIDFKSGNKKLEINDVYFGTQLQLLLYLDAVVKSGIKPEARPGGVFYFNLNDPILEYSKKTDEDIETEILKKFKMNGILVESPEVVDGLNKSFVGGKTMPVEEFDILCEQVHTKIKEIGEKMTSGEIKILPYKKGQITGCTYCKYGAICRFEKSDRYQVLK